VDATLNSIVNLCRGRDVAPGESYWIDDAEVSNFVPVGFLQWQCPPSFP
jgi:hypothetical protein